jgi:hypothetical protein
VFQTREQREAARLDSARPYFRLHDPLCQRFLEQAASPSEFAGLQRLFPFFRNLSVLQIPHGADTLPAVLYLAFLAGHDLGRSQPESWEEVLPGSELNEARRRLRLIRDCSGEEVLTGNGLMRALQRIVESASAGLSPEAAEEMFHDYTLRSLRLGFAAGTVFRPDPEFADLIGDMPERTTDDLSYVLSRMLARSPLVGVGTPLLKAMEHPLLRLVRDFYPEQPIEREVMLEFVRRRLRALKVSSEDACPVGEQDLAEWMAAGKVYGRGLRRHWPEVLHRIFVETRRPRHNASLGIVRKVITEAGGTQPEALREPFQRWLETTYGPDRFHCYGERLARVAYLACFAVWIPWVT